VADADALLEAAPLVGDELDVADVLDEELQAVAASPSETKPITASRARVDRNVNM
jgi:hypothetical protein